MPGDSGTGQVGGRAGPLSFLGEFVRHPVATAAIAPSSRRLGELMLRGADLTRVRTVVEYGPGTGAFTRLVLRALREARNDSAALVAIELNERLAVALPARCGDDPRLRVVNASAADVRAVLEGAGEDGMDLVVSGLGWPSLPSGVRDRIIDETSDLLRPGGSFRTFGYHVGLLFPGAWRFRERVRARFASVSISEVVWGNIPPAFVYTCNVEAEGA